MSRNDLEIITTDETKFNLKTIRDNLIIGGTALVCSTGLAWYMPTLYSALMQPEVDDFSKHYISVILAGINVATPSLGVAFLREAYKEAAKKLA